MCLNPRYYNFQESGQKEIKKLFSHYLLSRFKAEMWDKLKKKIKNLIIGCEKSISNFHNLNFQTFLWFLCGHVFFVFKLNPDIVEEEKRIRDDKLLPVNMCASRNRLIYRYITVLYIQGIKCCSAKCINVFFGNY